MDSSPRSSRRHGRQHCNNGRRVGDLIKQIEHFDQLSISTEHEFCYPESSLRLKEPIGMLSDARSTSRETRILDPSIIQVRRVDALRRLRRNNSDSIYQNQSVGPFSSDSKRAYSKNRVLNHQESRMMNMSGGRQCSEQCYVKCRNGKESEKYSRDIPLISLRGETVESNCFGRSTYTPEKLSREGVSFSGNLTSQTSLRDVQHRERNLGKSTPQTSSHEVPSRGGIGFSGCGSSETHLESKKSNRSLRKFSCMSSADVLPTLTLTTGSRNTPHIHNGQKRNRNSRESRQVISFLARSTGCVPRQISHREGLLPEAHSLSNMEQSVSPTELSLLPDSNDCSVRQNTISFGSIVSSSTEMQERHNDHGNERNINTPTCSLNSSEATTQVSFDENGGTFVAVHGRDIVRNIGEVDVEERTEVDSRSSQSSINISTGYISTSVTSNMIDPSSSTSRNGHITSNSLYEQMQNHTEALEDISFPSSCMSSPDGHQPADSSTFHSHDLRQMLSSSQYYQMGYHGRSARATQYRPFRRFPLRSYEENEEYLTFGGSSEVLSTRGHVERDDISYEQAFMLEANLLLRGISSYDRHRDLRLDIDNMSYEDLLSLEESMGFVSTGLEQDMISKCVQSEKYIARRNDAPYLVSDGIEINCSICQEDFEENIVLGLLKCGHKYHFTCIEQWLQRKNECPICKTTALSSDP